MTSQENSNDAEQMWIGLVALFGEPSNAILQGATGGYSTFISPAVDQQEFYAKAHESASQLGLQVSEVVWTEPLSSRIQVYDIDEDLLELARASSCDGLGRFGTFHTWVGDN